MRKASFSDTCTCRLDEVGLLGCRFRFGFLGVQRLGRSTGLYEMTDSGIREL